MRLAVGGAGNPHSAGHAVQLVGGQVQQQDLRNPMPKLLKTDPLKATNARERHLEDHELRALWTACGDMGAWRRFPAPWHADKISGGYVVRDANGQALAYVYARETVAEALQAKVLTPDEARRIAVNIARLPELLRQHE